ncbi:hypothetical protein BDC45DRAFT_537728 [Circinella umbellata]|nr:hypothetical protein BDC45DRAFT_537728 [Circinella umbellata]
MERLSRIIYNSLVAEQGNCEQTVWKFLDTVFDSSKEVFVNSGERASKATPKNHYKDRVTGALQMTNRKKVGTKVYLLYSTQLYEVGAMEAGSSDLYLQFVIADCSGGHVCRVTKLPDYLPYLVSARSFVFKFSALLHVA